MDKNAHQRLTWNKLHDLLYLLSNGCDDESKSYNIFSRLGVYLLSNDEHRAVIIKHRILYSKIVSCLNRARSLQTAVMLNFISALLYIDADEGPTRRKALYIYAQYMIRASGCLSAMCDLFVSSMLPRATWRALCGALADACRGASPNQSCCSHLVPLCIQRCNNGNVDVIMVLQSLLENHKSNNKLFHINNGMTIFSRNLLNDTACLHLLNTVLENISKESMDNIAQVHTILTELHKLSISAECPAIVQWKSIIFYSYQKVLGNYAWTNNNVIQNKKDNFEIEDTRHTDDTELLFQNVLREVRNMNCDNNKVLERNKNNNIPNRDIFQRPYRNKFIKRNSNLKNRCPKSLPTFRHKDLSRNKDFSFSFLLNMNNTTLESNIENAAQAKVNISNTANLYHTSKIIRTNRLATTSSLATDFEGHNSQIASAIDCEINFKPSFASTPKHPRLLHNSILNATPFQARHNHIRKIKPVKRIETQHMNSSVLKNRSLSSKFLDAVNQSCTTIMKSFKKVFNKASPNKSKGNINNETNMSVRDCSYSFTNYMRKRDEFLSNENSKIVPEKDVNYNLSCSTCNNTLELKDKLVSDQHLRETIKKLKLGINLFGCDFKKISNTFWPNEKFMTPKLLYNLYRKLIVK